MAWLMRHRLFWPLIVAIWTMAGFNVWYVTRRSIPLATPPTIPCTQGMMLLPQQSCVLSVPIGPRREETSY